MPSAESDLVYLEAGLEDLENYLLSDELYWAIHRAPPAGNPPFPRVTLGNMMLSRKRLEGRSLTARQEAEFNRLAEEMDRIRLEWRVAWGKKASHEFHARVLLWRDFLEEYREMPDANVDRYAYEVTRRVLLDLLRRDGEEIPSHEVDLLTGLDSVLRTAFVPGDFIWEPDIQPAFPVREYWYLYGRLKDENG